jgi:uncharacterized heparinase superfamily protein
MPMMRAVRLSDYLGASVSAARREASATLNSINPFHFRLSIDSAADRLAVVPEDFYSADSERGDAILAGRVHLAGETMDVASKGNVWTQTTPSRAFARRLHSFAWLRDCCAAEDLSAPETACELTDSWIANFGRWNSFAWSHDVLASRVMNWLRCGSVLYDCDAHSTASRTRRLRSLVEQLRYLQRSLSISPDGAVRLRGAAALTLGGLCLKKQTDLLKSGFTALEAETARQILPDGGHVSRSPRAGAEALVDLITVQKAADERGVQFPDSLLRAISRLAPMVRFFEATDGGLFSFHGGGEYDRQALKHAFDIHDTTSRAFGFAPHTGYHRAHAGDATVVLDAGEAARGALSTGAHASALAFEMSTGGGRLIVNCGWHDDQPPNWREAVRATAAHSTLTLEETSSARLLAPGWKRDLLGPRLESTPGPVTARRNEEDMGVWIEATHDGYREAFGLSHRRRVFLAADGGDLRGEDALYRPVSDGAPDDVDIRWRFAIRFHLHPDVRASLSRDSMSALLVQPGGDGWRFRTDGGPVRLERSVYLAAGAPPQRATQIVVYGDAEPYGAGDKPPNRVRWAFQRLGQIGGAGGEKE